MSVSLKKTITLLIFLALAIGMMIGVSIFVKPIVDNNIMKEKIEEYSQVLSGIDKIEDFEESEAPDTIIDEKVAFDADGEQIGFLYKATGENAWGSITIIAVISDTGEILGLESTVKQSLRAEETKEFIAKHKGSTIASPEAVDGSTGPTTRDSVALVDSLLDDINTAHGVVPISDPYALFYGAGYELEEDTDFATSEIITKRQVVTNDGDVKGVVFTATASGVYNGSAEGSMKFNVLLDDEGVVKMFEKLEYEHTEGFYSSVEAYLNDNVIGELIADYEKNDNLDDNTGATNSIKVIEEIILAIGSLDEFDPYVAVFGSGYTLEEDTSFSSTTITTMKQVAKIDDNVVGYIYTATANGVYTGQAKESITMDFVLDKDNKVGLMDPVEYNHSSGYYSSVVSYYNNKLIGNSIVDFDTNIDGSTGATNSITLINEMITDIKGVINNG